MEYYYNTKLMEKYKRYLDQDVDFDNIDSDDECAIEKALFF